MRDIMALTDGWLTDWGEEGGLFKEWVRHMHLAALSDGWPRAIAEEPGRWYRRARHVLSWLPFLWSDHDFDQVYLWKIMREKIRRMRVYQEEEQFISDWSAVAEQMRVAELVLTRLIEDKYVDEEWEAHRAKYGSALDRMEELPDGGAVMKPHSDPECGNDVRRIGQREWQLKRADAKFLGDYLARHMWGWWS